MSLGNCPICGKPRGGPAKAGRDHSLCSKKLKKLHGDSSARPAEKRLRTFTESTVDYICKRYDK